MVAQLLQSLVASVLGGAPARPGALRDSRSLDAAMGLLARRILVADDNPANQALARAILEAAGAEVVAVGDGLEAIAALRDQSFDAVLMDVRMPRMDGPEALARIRAGETGGRDIPVIALTAEAADAQILLRAGFDGVQPKPVDAAGLVGAVTAACRRPRGERHAAAA